MYLKSSNLLFILSQERLRTDLYICEGNYYYQQMQANYSRGVISAGEIHCQLVRVLFTYTQTRLHTNLLTLYQKANSYYNK